VRVGGKCPTREDVRRPDRVTPSFVSGVLARLYAHRVPEFVAYWGAVTGTLGAAIAIRREIHLSRMRVGIDHRLNMTINRETGELTGAWLSVRLWNTGGRTFSIERVGVEWLHEWREGNAIHIGRGRRTQWSSPVFRRHRP